MLLTKSRAPHEFEDDGKIGNYNVQTVFIMIHFYDLHQFGDEKEDGGVNTKSTN